MSISPLSRRQILAGVIFLTSFAAPFAAQAAETTQPSASQPASVEERLHDSNGRQTDLQIARGRPDIRDVEARVRDQRANWSSAQWDAYGRSMRGQ